MGFQVTFVPHVANNTILPWQQGNNDRSSFNILYSCLATIFLCVWVSVYPNVPGSKDSWKCRLRDKAHLALIGCLAPDLLFVLALGQYSSAKRSVETVKNFEWSVTHGFFADMGGFRITSTKENDKFYKDDGIPVNSRQLLYLVQKGYIKRPQMTKDEIRLLSSEDRFSKFIVVWQVLWFLIVESMRFASHLPITPLELTTMISAVMMVATSAVWFKKPHAQSAKKIPLERGLSFEDIRNDARRSPEYKNLVNEWYDTPLDFIWKRGQVRGDRHWQWYSYLSHKMYLPLFTRLPTYEGKAEAEAWDRVPSDILHAPRGPFAALAVPLQLAYSLSYLAAWNFHFSTDIERWMWRGAAIYHAVYCVLLTGYFIILLAVKSRKNRKNGELQEERQGEEKQAQQAQQAQQIMPPGNTQLVAESSVESIPLPAPAKSCDSPSAFIGNSVEEGLPPDHCKSGVHKPFTLKYWRNLSPEGDPDCEVSLRWTAPFFVLTILYVFSQLFIYVECFVSLRSQPADVYFVDQNYFPLMS